jgi:hypothetical protein
MAPAKRGICRRCGCTDKQACRFMVKGLFGPTPCACSWIDAEHTMCNSCFFAVDGKDARTIYLRRKVTLAERNRTEVLNAYRR